MGDGEYEERLREAMVELEQIRQPINALCAHVHEDLARINLDKPETPYSRDRVACEREGASDQLWTRRPALDVCQVSVNSLIDVGLHLQAISRLLHLPVYNLAILTLIRTTLEIASRTWWLLEPDISCRERVTRMIAEGINSRHQDLRGFSKFSDAYSTDLLEWRYKAEVERAVRLGLAIKYEKSGRVSISECRVPSATELIDVFFREIGEASGAAIYAVLSAATHGQSNQFVRIGGFGQFDNIPPTLGVLVSILQIPVNAARSLHIRCAQYLGSSSPARSRPYQQVVGMLQVRRRSDLIIGHA